MTNTNYSARVIHGEYYPHIDGIRALAVLPVVLFHILAALCPGGFVGVDVFFVISGYLITGGILRDLENSRFTIRNFYHRRIRRIMPAYFALIVGVFAAGCIFYYATPLKFLGDAVTAGTLFLANFHFWMLGGDYFAPQLHSQALLHLWSLSVEEQFYLFIPLLCAVTWKFRRGLVAPVLALLAVLSLSGAIYAVMTGKQSSAFYLLHFRAWELLAGSLLAMIPAVASKAEEASPLPTEAESTASGKKDAPATSATKYALLATTGLLLVLIPYVVISSRTPFPGAAVLPSVIGTALLIRYGQIGWVSRLLSWRPFVLTGKISYSLYLWHWPVTVFWKYAVYDQLYFYDYIGMFLLSLLLAFLSWKFVELPVRASPAWTMGRSFAFAASGITLLVALGTACVFYQGWPIQLHSTANQFVCDNPRTPFFEARIRAIIRRIGTSLGQTWCASRVAERYESLDFSCGEDANTHIGKPGQPEVFLMGDSHAGSLQYGLDATLRNSGHSGYVVSRSAAIMFDPNVPECQEVLTELKKNTAIQKIILLQFWTHYDRQSQMQKIAPIYDRLEKFAFLIKAMNKTLYIATDNPRRDFSPGDIAAKMQIVTPRRTDAKWEGKQSKSEYDRMQGKINQRLAEICQKTGAVLIPLHLGLIKGDFYPAFMEQNGKTVPLYRDETHLSPYGSLHAAQFIMPYLFPKSVLQDQSDQ